ncbi:MAG: hypothetical protein A2340_02355 [Lentisphaerae bacterium RIFOXYB12_FULL_60_10]|nr:MAG: hypothetical protein A2340_02355 [Lentisphaerae bacterium RIFOXYB12_FULL_60_10]
MNLPERIRQRLKDAPDLPGCYLFRDRQGRIIYVGKAVSIRRRLQSYFRNTALRRGDPKLRSLVNSVCDIEFFTVRNEAEALLSEGRLIKEYKPRYNILFKDDKRFVLLRTDPREPFPQFRLCRLARQDGAVYFGPYVSSPSARVTLDFIERHYGIRHCEPREPDASTYRHCLNDIIRTCSGPCVGKVTPEAYRQRFDEACAFLHGDRPQVLKDLRDRMRAVAATHDFERAAALRDTLLSLEQIIRQKARVVMEPEMKRQDAEHGLQDLQAVLGLPTIPRRMECFDVSTISGTFSVASMVSARDGVPAPARYRRFRIRTVAGSDDPAMIAEVITRRYRRVHEEGGEWPDLVIVDGGITQLRAARAALERLGHGSLPVIGLAKKLEAIHWRDPGEPIQLALDSPGLRVIRRLRDEAHRFALAYHRRLRNRRIRESVLDDIPGIGPHRKRRLLERFGSVRRLTEAPEDEVAGVPGIGLALARLIRQTLVPDSETASPAGEGIA